MAKAPKMTNLVVDETSGVDHPAHLREGWLVFKSVTPADADAVLAALAADPDAKEAPMPDETKVDDEQTAPTADDLADALAKANEQIADLTAQVAALTPAAAEPTEDDVLKSAPPAVVAMIQKARESEAAAVAKAAEYEAKVEKARIEKADADAVALVKSWEHLTIDADAFGPSLRKMQEADADLAKSVVDVLTAANAQNDTAALFTEMGKSAGAPTGGAYDRMVALAKSLVADGTAPTFEQALAKVAETNPDLYAAHISEKGA